MWVSKGKHNPESTLRGRIKKLQKKAQEKNDPNDWARLVTLQQHPPEKGQLDRVGYKYRFIRGQSRKSMILSSTLSSTISGS
jgi:hypothetical protein